MFRGYRLLSFVGGRQVAVIWRGDNGLPTFDVGRSGLAAGDHICMRISGSGSTGRDGTFRWWRG
jgi:hypothetical protein